MSPPFPATAKVSIISEYTKSAKNQGARQTRLPGASMRGIGCIGVHHCIETYKSLTYLSSHA